MHRLAGQWSQLTSMTAQNWPCRFHSRSFWDFSGQRRWSSHSQTGTIALLVWKNFTVSQESLRFTICNTWNRKEYIRNPWGATANDQPNLKLQSPSSSCASLFSFIRKKNRLSGETLLFVKITCHYCSRNRTFTPANGR